MDKDIQDMLNDLPNKKFSKLKDGRLLAIELLSQRLKSNENPFKKGHTEERKKIIGLQKKGNKNCVGRKMSNETKEKIGNSSRGKTSGKIVECYFYPSMEYKCDYNNLTEASKELKLNRECARLTCVGERNQTGGYTFRYKDILGS